MDTKKLKSGEQVLVEYYGNIATEPETHLMEGNVVLKKDRAQVMAMFRQDFRMREQFGLKLVSHTALSPTIIMAVWERT